jgi:hypothetical protein
MVNVPASSRASSAPTIFIVAECTPIGASCQVTARSLSNNRLNPRRHTVARSDVRNRFWVAEQFLSQQQKRQTS